mmetsp:Transcript_41236/g.67691  ORF Transcript_41236/g.67691 Transcript_41236/m.67691 type:complete len:144 (-) Transcript_41236:73-504(-)
MTLLGLMKLMATYRCDLGALDVYKEMMQENAAGVLEYSLSVNDIFNHVSSFLMGEAQHDGRVELDCLPESIQKVISAIRHHGNENCLIHLRDTIPFTKDHAPTLFAGVIDNPAPPELWMMFQDCFFETPALNNILHEFLPEED